MEGMDSATWHEGAHVRDMALSYALLLLRSRIVTVDTYLQEAGKMWDFLRTGTVPLSAMKAEDFPDDLSSLVPAPTVDTEKPPFSFPDLLAAANGESREVDEETKKAMAEMFGMDPDQIARMKVTYVNVPRPEQPEDDPGQYLDDRVVNQEWENLDGQMGGYATNPGVVQKHTPGIVNDGDDD